MANEFIARNGLIAQNNSTITGSLIITGSSNLTGSFEISNGTDSVRLSRGSGAGGRLIFSRPGSTGTQAISIGGGNSELSIGSNDAKQLKASGVDLEISNTETNGNLIIAQTVGSTGTIVLRGTSNTNGLTFFTSTKNLVLQNGGTFIDDTVNRLQVSGSVKITNGLTVTGSITSSGTITPSINSTYNIGGGGSLRFANGYFSSTLYASTIRGTQLVFGDEVGGNYLKIFPSPGNIAISNVTSPTDLGYRLQVSGSTSGSLYTDGFVNHTGTISSSIQPSNNPSASLMVIGGTTIQSSSITNSSAVLINPIMSASANSQTLVGLDIAPTFTNGAFTGVQNIALRVPNGSYISAQGSSTTNSYNFYLASGETVINAPTLGGNVSFRLLGTKFGQFMPTTGNLVLQNGGTFTDDTVNRLQVSGSARITNNLTVTGSTTSTQGFIKPGAGSQYLLADGTTTSSTGGSPFPYIGNAEITGSLNVSGSITGSLFGTASYAVTASYALNGGGGSSGPSLGLVQAFSLGLQNIF